MKVEQHVIENGAWNVLTHSQGVGSIGRARLRISGNKHFNMFRRPYPIAGRPFAMGQGSYWGDEFGRFLDQRIIVSNRKRPIVMKNHFHTLALHGSVPSSESELTSRTPTSATYVRRSRTSSCWPIADEITRTLEIEGDNFVQRATIVHRDEQSIPRVLFDHPFYLDADVDPLIVTASFEAVTISLGGLENPFPLDFPAPIVPGSDLDYSRGRRVPRHAEHSYYGKTSDGVELKWERAGVRIRKSAIWQLNDGPIRPFPVAHGFTGLRSDSVNFPKDREVDSTTAFEDTMSGANWNLLSRLGFLADEYCGVTTSKGDRLTMMVTHTVIDA